MRYEWSTVHIELEIVDHSATGGPKMEIAVRTLTNMVMAAGDTIITGSLTIKRNRFRGQWRPGWMVACQAIRLGQSHGYGKEYSLQKVGDEYKKPEQFRFEWKDV